MANKDITIGLLWHSMNSDNLGVGALSLANMAIIREAAAAVGLTPRFVVLCWDDPAEDYRSFEDVQVVRLRARHLIRPDGLWRAVRGTDVVFDIGAGDSFADLYGAPRILKMMLAQAVVLMAGRPLLLSPQTIGPFRRRWSRWLAGLIVRRAAAVVARDAPSAALARSLGAGSQLTEATDVALRLPYADCEAMSTGAIRIGINVSGLLYNGGYTGKNMFGLALDYPALMRDVVGHFAARPGCEVHLIAHVQSPSQPVEDDRQASLALAREFPGCVVAPVFPDPEAAKTYIAGMDFFIGARMHACIAAMSSGVPAVPVAYSRKFAGLFGTLGYPVCADCRSESRGGVLARVIEAFDNRAELRDEAIAALGRGRERLARYEAVVRDGLVRAAGVPS